MCRSFQVQSNALLQRVGQLGLTESTTSKSFQEPIASRTSLKDDDMRGMVRR